MSFQQFKLAGATINAAHGHASSLSGASERAQRVRPRVEEGAPRPAIQFAIGPAAKKRKPNAEPNTKAHATSPFDRLVATALNCA